jgi:hypothetical protein
LESLEDYLGSEFLSERQEVATIDRTLLSVAGTFTKIFDGRMWPYEFRLGEKRSAGASPVSQGTLAMVLTATGRLLGHCSLPKGTFGGLVREDLEGLETNWQLGLKTLLTSLSGGKVSSSSFGKNNPLTLSHLSELNSLLRPDKFEQISETLSARISIAKDELSKRLQNDPAISEALLTPPRGRYYRNAFVPLRSLRAAAALKITTAAAAAKYRIFFESTLHDQLSFSSIPDSRFDPAELIFCLEGLLLCAPEGIDASLFNRVLEVLAEAQNSSAYWRPNKPFIASATGDIMLPISVEGANSLMRSTAIMDENRLYDTFTAKALPLIHRFWHWLRARSVRFESQGTQCLGWHSEHVNDPNLVHIWDTSQVTEFLISLREMLERHIGSKSLRLSRLSVLPAKSQLGFRGAIVAKKEWALKAKTFDPQPGESSASPVYTRLWTDFVQPWSADAPVNYSMLLYGPAGTGKSTVAENLAQVLNMPLITVTISDFLGSGGALVEARAKAIFQTLEAQDRCVILFDEIDSFLLDRDSKLYRDQDSLFQFLTPGMLTKINDLRKCRRSIFIIATNYADRIDPAIKRTGRIDKQYLLPLPNAKRRIAILTQFGFRKVVDRNRLVKETVFFGFSDLKGAAQDAARGTSTQEEVEASLRMRAPAASLRSYLARLQEKEKFPAEEFMGLAALANEARSLERIEEELEGLSAENAAKFLKSITPKQDTILSGWKVIPAAMRAALI